MLLKWMVSASQFDFYHAVLC